MELIDKQTNRENTTLTSAANLNEEARKYRLNQEQQQPTEGDNQVEIPYHPGESLTKGEPSKIGCKIWTY